jgi:hypothetical protein
MAKQKIKINEEHKAKEMYDYSREILHEEQKNFDRIDTKASLYFSIISLLFGIYGFFLKNLTNNFKVPDSGVKWFLFIFSFCAGIWLSVELLIAWIRIFRAVNLRSFKQMPLDENTLKWFSKNEMTKVYDHFAHKCAEGLEDNAKVRSDKGKNLEKAERNMFRILILILILLFLNIFNQIFVNNYNDFIAQFNIFLGGKR